MVLAGVARPSARQRHAEQYTQTHRQTDIAVHTDTHRQTEKQTSRLVNRETILALTLIIDETYRQTERDRQTDRKRLTDSSFTETFNADFRSNICSHQHSTLNVESTTNHV